MTFREMTEPYREQFPESMKQQIPNPYFHPYLDRELNEAFQQAQQKLEQVALNWNQFGQVLYSERCRYCTEHEDSHVTMPCDISFV